MDNQVFIIEFVDKFLNSSTVAVIIGALIAGWFGFKQYRSQKTWENINKRYFEEGIEDLITYLHNIRKANEDSYSNSLIALKYFRDLSIEDFKIWFKDFDLNNKGILFSMPKSFFIIKKIFKNENFDELCMNIFTNNASANDFLNSEIPFILNKYIRNSNSLKGSQTSLSEELMKQVVEKFKVNYEKSGIYPKTEILEGILFRLRKMNIDSYKRLEKAKNDKVIKNLLSEFQKIK